MKTQRTSPMKHSWALALALWLSGALLLPAQEPGMAAAPDADRMEKAKALLDQLAQQELVRQKERAFMAQKFVEAGKKHLLDKRYDEAIEAAKQAVDLAPANEEAKKLLVEARRLAGLQGPKNVQVVAAQAEAEKKVAMQVTRQEMLDALDRGKKFYGAKKYQEAIDAFERVATLGQSVPEMEGVEQAVQGARELISICKASIRREQALQREQTERSAKEILVAERRRQQHIIEARKSVLLGRAQFAVENGQFSLAENLADELLAIDPANVEASKLKSEVDRTRRGERQRTTETRSATNKAEIMVSTTEAMAPQTGLLGFAANWDEIKAKRPTSQVAVEEVPEWKKRVYQQLEKKVSFDFVDTPLADVVAFLQNLTGVNMVLDPASVQGQDVPVTLKVSDMRLGAAVDWILRLASLSYTLRDEAVFISSKAGIKEAEALRIYDVRDLLAQIPDYTGTSLPSMGEGGGEGGGGGDLFEGEGGNEEGMTGEDLVDFIKETIAPDSWGEGENP